MLSSHCVNYWFGSKVETSGMSELLLIRADGGTQMGSGHVMRGLALAQAWQDDGGHALFILADSPPALTGRLSAEGIEWRRLDVPAGSEADAKTTREMARLVILDGYHFGTDYQQAVKAAGGTVAVFDDYRHAGQYAADFIINQNLSASASLYAGRAPGACLLLGPKYVQLRREFLRWKMRRRVIADVGRRILVTMGGSDPDNVTAKVLSALPPAAETLALIGGGNPHRDTLARSQYPGVRMEVNSTQAAGHMAWTDIAITAGGTTSLELAFMGVPSLVLRLALNQSAGLGDYLGWHADVTAQEIGADAEKLLNDSARRGAMSERGRKTVDGDGGPRLCMRLRNQPLRLRRAVPEDCRNIWEMANDPETRAASFSSSPIEWEDHQRWFLRKLSEKTSFFYVAVDAEDALAGQVRFEISTSGRATVSFGLGCAKRGVGLGKTLLAEGLRVFFRDSSTTVVEGFVKTGNAASRNVFERCDFERRGPVTVQGHSAWHFVRERPKI